MSGDADRKQAGQGAGLATRVIALATALMLTALLAFGIGFALNGDPHAYATIHPASQGAQVIDQDSEEDGTDGDSETGGAGDEAEGSETEILDEEETPLSSGLGGGEPVSGGLGFVPFAIAGIAAVAVFFLVLMHRLNGSINDMNRMFK